MIYPYDPNRAMLTREVLVNFTRQGIIAPEKIKQSVINMAQTNPNLQDLLEREIIMMDGSHPETARTADILLYFIMQEQKKETSYDLTATGVPIISGNIHERIMGYHETREIIDKLEISKVDFTAKDQFLISVLEMQIKQLTGEHPDTAYNAVAFMYLLLEEQGKYNLAFLHR